MRRTNPGFTLIELLTVIAIIAILAAILFPVLKVVGDRARNAGCMSNMRAVWQALSLYKQDNDGAVPTALMGYVENPGGGFNTTGTGFVTVDQLLHGYLLARGKVNDPEKFRCPFNSPPRKDQVTVAHFPPRPPRWPNRSDGTSHSYITDPGTPLTQDCSSDAAGYVDCFRRPEYQPGDPLFGQPKYFYTWDSYDISPRIDASGKPVRIGGQLVYDRRYSPDWTGISGPRDLSNQLRYPNPPNDKTLVTFCSWHAVSAGMDKCPAINFGGTVQMYDVKLLFENGPNFFNR